MKGKVALFDMDGVLFDYEGQLRRDLDVITSDVEKEEYKLEEKDIWELEKIAPWMKKRIDLIKNQPDWWRLLPKFKLGWDVYEAAVEIGFCTQILTKGPRSRPVAWGEKHQCIIDHLGDDVPVNVVGKNKAHYYGRVLVDDYPDYVEGWLEFRPRGLAIMPLHDYNKRFLHSNIIHYDGQNLEEVKKALQAAHDRSSGQHWRDLL